MNNKIALVTGANRGIGFEICRQLARKSIRVILTARNVQKGNEAVNQLRTEGLDVTFVQLDVTDEQSVRDAAEYVEKNQGRLDILVNNAGVQGPIRPRAIRLPAGVHDNPAWVRYAKPYRLSLVSLSDPIASS